MNKEITEIQVATLGNRKISTEAVVSGKFAVHSQGRRLEVKPGGASYRITHIATGYSIGRCFGFYRSLSLAKELDALLPDWDITDQDFTRPFSARYEAFLTQARPLIHSAAIGEFQPTKARGDV